MFTDKLELSMTKKQSQQQSTIFSIEQLFKQLNGSIA
jgi:hypothetical protein